MASQPRPPVVGSTRWVETPWLRFKMFNGWCIRSQHGIAWCIQRVKGEAIARRKGEGQEDTRCRNAWHAQKYLWSVWLNSELTKGVWQVIKCSKWDDSVEWLSQKGHGFDQNWVWWQHDTQPAVQLCLVCHDPELCPTVWARWYEWQFWQQGDVLWCWLASLRQAFQSDTRINFLIARRPWEF